MSAPTIGTESPWGSIQTVEPIRPGVWSVSTASHGGYYLDATANRRIPQAVKLATWGQQGLAGWYEEDCDVSLVAAILPGVAANDDQLKRARSFARMYRPGLALDLVPESKL